MKGYIEYTHKETLEKREQIKNIFLKVTGLNDNLKSIKNHHLLNLIELYDGIFFEDYFFDKNIEWLVSFNNRMTRCGGIIKRHRTKDKFKLTFSKPLILCDDYRPNQEVNGLFAKTQMEALQLIMEHELLHAYQFCIYDASDHSNTFKTEAYDIFGHTKTTHGLRVPFRVELRVLKNG